mmetsp:Transcript_25781/g.32089  ORF Transcript_25781/g.32089 Transcript_25781/m.32089 type:complete len:89 (-) Transcript_25781:41-307(-)
MMRLYRTGVYAPHVKYSNVVTNNGDTKRKETSLNRVKEAIGRNFKERSKRNTKAVSLEPLARQTSQRAALKPMLIPEITKPRVISVRN